MKRVLIISPHFPPINAPDMHRIRMSLPYYKALGWEPVVLCVDENYVSGFKDELLNESIPKDIEVHKINAWPEKTTRKFGLGSLSLRAYYHFKKKGTELLSQRKFDLVFFSTTSFPVCALGRYWQKKFGLSFVIDMQDPWRNDFYLSKPNKQRPSKFWLLHAVNKRMEAYTMPYVNGIMSVSQAYIDSLQKRYRNLKNKPAILLPFGTSLRDFEMVKERNIAPEIIQTDNGKINVVYVGVINQFFLPLLRAFFTAFIQSVAQKEQYHFYFIGTNYNVGSHEKPVAQLAAELNLSHLVTEVPQRISYFAALATLLHSDILFIPGSLDAEYNASKIYHNIFTGKPVFSIFNENSLVKKVIDETGAGIAVGLHEGDDLATMIKKIKAVMPEFMQLHQRPTQTDMTALEKYFAPAMAEKQVVFFNSIIPVLPLRQNKL